jgi:hypothetical protein
MQLLDIGVEALPGGGKGRTQQTRQQRAAVVGAHRRTRHMRRHDEGVGRRRQPGQRAGRVGIEHCAGDPVHREGDAQMALAVGIGQRQQVQRPIEAGQPFRQARRIAEQIDASACEVGGGILARLAIERRQQCCVARHHVGEGAQPHLRQGAIDGDHVGAPVRQHVERPDLGAGTDQDDGTVGQVEPLRIRHAASQRGRCAGFDDVAAFPVVRLAQQRIVLQQLPAVGNLAGTRSRVALPCHAQRMQWRRAQRAPGLAQRPPPIDVGPVQRIPGAVESGAGAGQGQLGIGQGMTHQGTDVVRIIAPPLPFGKHPLGQGRVEWVQGRRDDAGAGLRTAARTIGGRGKLDTKCACRGHGAILARHHPGHGRRRALR